MLDTMLGSHWFNNLQEFELFYAEKSNFQFRDLCSVGLLLYVFSEFVRDLNHFNFQWRLLISHTSSSSPYAMSRSRIALSIIFCHNALSWIAWY
uniref:Uncharacterized protein n=1 Tax=Leersia perrieri TaxID=77586 RepID=A0A0D9Y0A7_9ORYZ